MACERDVATVGGRWLSRLRRTTVFQDELAIRCLPPAILALSFVVGIFVAVES